MPVEFYNSIQEFSAALPDETLRSRDDSWSGGYDYAASRKRLWSGDQGAIKRSDELLDQMEADGIELETSYWDNDRAGSIPCIPSYVAGSPESMRRMVETTSDTTPIKIFASVCLSGGFSSDQLETRGTAILALARKLTLIRPVELWVYADMYGRKTDSHGNCAIPIIKLDTAPLDLATVSYALANAGFLRQLCFAWGYERGFEGPWAWDSTPERHREKMRGVLQASETDLVIDGAYLTDELMRKPLQWVNNQVKRYSSTLEAD